MMVSVASLKGGVGKTTTAIHLAGYLQTLAPTLLVDNDPNRSALGWAGRSEGKLKFKVGSIHEAMKESQKVKHVVIDTKARPDNEELKTIADGCDFLVVPTTPDVMSIEALMATVGMLKTLHVEKFKVLITMVPPYPERDGEEARQMLEANGFPCFKASIRSAKVFKQAALDGQLVIDMKSPRAAACWEDYTAVAKEMMAWHRRQPKESETRSEELTA